MTKTQENITHKRAKSQALSQQVTTRLQRTDNKAWQTRKIDHKSDPQKKHRLDTISKKYFTGGLKLVLWFQPLPYQDKQMFGSHEKSH